MAEWDPHIPEPDEASNSSPYRDKESNDANGWQEEDYRWLRSVVENSLEIITVVDPDGTLRYANPAFQKVLGYDLERVVGAMSVLDQVHAEDLPPAVKHADAGVLPELALRDDVLEYRFRHADGSWRWMESVITHLPGDAEAQGVLITARDITERKEAEESFKAQYKNFPVPTYTWQRVEDDFALIEYNDAAYEHSRGYVNTLLGCSAAELLADWPGYYEMVERCYRDRESVSQEMPWRMMSTGEDRRFIVTSVFVPPDLVMVHVEDITERVRAEGRLRFQAQLLGAVGEAVIALDMEGNVAYWNRAAEKIYGWTAEEAMGRYLREMVVPEDLRGRAEEITTRVREEGNWSGEFVVRRRDGTPFAVEANNTLVRDENGAAVGTISVFREITERKKAEEKYRTLVERVPPIIYIQRPREGETAAYDTEYISPRVEEVLGYPPQRFTEDPDFWNSLIHPEDVGAVVAEDERTDANGEPFEMEYRVFTSDGSVKWIRDEATLVRDEAGEPSYWLGVQTDVSDRKQIEEALRKSEASLSEAQRLAHLGSWEWNVNTGEVWWSDEIYRIYGFEPGETVPTLERLLEVVHPEDRGLLRAAIDAALYDYEPYDLEHRVVRPDGVVRVVHRQAEVERGERGEPLRMIGTVHDITERKVLEQRLKHQAYHDLLTDLPNRHLFIDRLGQALKRTRRRRRRQVAILYMDLDGFKVVNDSLGHETGDRLLVAVASRLEACLRPEDTLARFGGDEFVVLIEDIAGRGDVVWVAERIVEELQNPIHVDGRELYVSASIGVAVGNDRGRDPEGLLRDADTAMYQAKGQDVGYAVFEPSMYERAVTRLELENDLRRAIQRDEFVVHYQPIMHFANNTVWAMEALVRWKHPERGLLNPGDFVPVAEESGLVVSLGEGLLREACYRAREWHQRNPRTPQLVLCANVSGRQLERPNLPEIVQQTLGETGLGSSCLCLDITETVYVKASEGVARVLSRLRAMGVKVAVDDFGTGFSSLAYLKRLPVDILKIDKSFVAGLGENIEDSAIVRMIIELAHTLSMEVVAEGVENAEQAALLMEMGCDCVQGYYFSEPLVPEEVPGFLAR